MKDLKVDDVFTEDWQSVEQIMKKTNSKKTSVMARLNKLFNNWQVVEKKRENKIMYYRLKKKQ